MNNNLVLEKARELGQLIMQSEELARFRKAEAIWAQDPVAQLLTENYNKKREELMLHITKEDIDKDEIEQVREQIVFEFEKMAENKIVKEYVESAEAFSSMVAQMNSIISYYVKGGEEKNDCGGGGCGGCKGC